MHRIHAGPHRFNALTRYAFAIALAGAALGLSLVLQVPFGNPFWLFFPVAIVASTWFGGRGPGWVAVFLSAVAVLYYFIPPFRSFLVKPRDIPFFLAFVACEVIANRLVSWRRETEGLLKQSHDQLEVRVRERTAELKQANEALLNQMEEQRRTEEALQVTRSELARVVRITTIGELAASIAHEVNQPLAAVVANADACVAWLTRDDPNLVEARAAAERTTQGATRASEVISRIRSLINKTAPERIRIQINEIIEEVVALADRQASRNEVSVVTELTPDLPLVVGDRIQLQQVILNLMLNGIEAMSGVNDRSRRLVVRSRMQDAEQIRVSIEDCGIGVTEKNISRLFEPFFTTRSQGIGMGLPISRSIVEAHGGRLWAESTVNQGSVFQFTLPKLSDPAT
ncbi:MAG: ATP-binding protein [Candidatus Sulfotelmatobacter sp.]|jgi:C4-dicarboxylate-specific signal transduction histidine kinase